MDMKIKQQWSMESNGLFAPLLLTEAQNKFDAAMKYQQD